MTTDVMESRIQEILDFAQTQTTTKRGLIPTFLGYPATGKGIMIAAPWTDEADKDIFIEIVRRKFAEEKIEAYLLASEVWISTKLDAQPRHDPKRREAMSVLYVDRTRAIQNVFPITRHKHLITLGERQVFPDVKGRMSDLLPRRL